MSDTTVVTNQSIAPSPAPLVPFNADILAGQLAPSSIAMYQRDFAAYVEFSGSAYRALQPPMLARWRTHLAHNTDKSPNTINRMLSAVKRVIREAANQGYLDGETAAAFGRLQGVRTAALKDRTKQNARVRIEPDQMRVLCDMPNVETLVGVRDRALLATLATGALRVSECVSLTLGQIHSRDGGYVVSIRGKNDVEFREAPLGREAMAHVQTWLQLRPVESQYVFTAFDGRGDRASDRPLSAVAVWKIVRRYAADAGLGDVKPHDFRRFVGTQLARQDIRMAQKALGHKRIETTARHYVLDEIEVGITDDLY